MEYWDLEVADAAMPPSPAAVAIKVGNTFFKKNWGVFVIGGATMVYFLMVQAMEYWRRVREHHWEEMERREKEDEDQRANPGDREAVELVQQMNQRGVVAAQTRLEAQSPHLENLIQNQDQICSCM